MDEAKEQTPLERVRAKLSRALGLRKHPASDALESDDLGHLPEGDRARILAARAKRERRAARAAPRR